MSLKEGAFLNVLNEKVMYSHAEFVFNIAKRASVIYTLLDSKQVTIFQKHNTGNITDTLLEEGLAKQMYGWGWGGSLSRELTYLLQTQMLCTSSKTKNRSESGK